MSSFQLKRKNHRLLMLFVVGLIGHIISVSFMVKYLGPVIANWVNGVIQTVITVYVVHALARLFGAHENQLWPVNRRVARFTTFAVLCLFWVAFAVHMVVWPFSRDLLRITGWVAFGASLLTIGALYGRNRFYLIKELRLVEFT